MQTVESKQFWNKLRDLSGGIGRHNGSCLTIKVGFINGFNIDLGIAINLNLLEQIMDKWKR